MYSLKMCKEKCRELLIAAEVLRQCYFEMVPLHTMYEIFEKMDVQLWKLLCDADIQDRFLEDTIMSAHHKKYPPDSGYSYKFCKDIITQVEQLGFEVTDKFYDAFGQILHDVNETERRATYKTYFFNNDVVTVEETLCLIKSGTTGLRTWDAGRIMSQWCIENKNFFENKRVIEFGSGVGFTGICICKFCEPARFTFTDCHAEVLEVLYRNACLNLKLDDSSKRQDSERCDCNPCNNTDNREVFDHRRINRVFRNVEVDILDWTLSATSSLNDFDVIIASDIVYDVDLIPQLVRVFGQWLSGDTGRVAYIACTVRNVSTTEYFLKSLGNVGVTYAEMDCNDVLWFRQVDGLPIKIFKLNSQRC